MVGYRMSRTGIAKKPFFAPSIARNFWSVEELCWFLTRYPALIDEEFVSVRVTRWLAEEFHITRTALRMEQGMKQGKGAEDFLLPLFQDTEYLTSKELSSFSWSLRRLGTLGPSWRLKLKADALVENHRYGQAVLTYRKAREGAPDHDRVLHAQISHNCGTAWMRLLECGEAAEEFLAAYEESGREEERRAYLTALLLGGMPERAEAEALRLRAPAGELPALRDAMEAAGSGVSGASPDGDGLRRQLSDLCTLYHREAG